MAGLLVTLILLVGAPLLFGARSRISRLELRLRLVEEELRRRIAAAAVPSEPASAIAAIRGAEPESEAEFDPAAWAKVEMPEHGLPLDQAEAPPAPALARAAEPMSAAAAIPAASVPPPVAAPASPAPRRPAIGFEELFGRRLPIWAGGVTLAIAGVLIVKYAIDAGFFARVFTPGVQAICGMLFGLGLIGGAEWAHRRREAVDDPRVSQALSGAGISTLYAAVLVSANIYALIPPLAAFLGLAAVTGAALWLSLRHGVPSALLGLAGGLAAPALTLGIDAEVPMLAAYLGFTIAGLVGVSRIQRWPWLAALALAGGAGWSLWLILAGEALNVLGALSVGTFVILLAIAAPLFAFHGAAARLLRAVAAVVGAGQLALLVATGGFQPLHWGLFALIAAAGQWLAWRDRDFAIVPTLGAALSVLLLLVWPAPAGNWLATVGLALGAIHAVPLLARLWREPARLQRAVELAGISAAAPLVTLIHFHAPWGEADPLGAASAAGGALLALLGAALGWRTPGREDDARLALLLGGAGGLLSLAAWLAFPHWQVPLWIGLAALALLLVARPARDWRIEFVAGGYTGLAALALLATMPARWGEALVLVGLDGTPTDAGSLARWLGVAALGTLLGARAQRPLISGLGQVLAALAGYGALAQLAPPTALAPALAAAVVALALASKRIDWRRLRVASLALAALGGAWALLPLLAWLSPAILSLGGVPMVVDADELAAAEVLRRLLVPALLLGGALWLLRERVARPTLLLCGGALAAVGLVALHVLYRSAFAAAFGVDFVALGLAQRLLWCALLLAAAVGLWQRGGGRLATRAAPALTLLAGWHLGWYSLVLHNPLWSEQAVGPLPVANLILPLFAALPLCLMLLARMRPEHAGKLDHLLQPLVMGSIALFGWASLRHAFHGSVLSAPGLGQSEDILRSILGIALAVGFLLWGIRRGRRDWRIGSLLLMLAAVAKVFLLDASGLEGLLRIASFVALGFSLIGIGWLYSRQLRRDESA